MTYLTGVLIVVIIILIWKIIAPYFSPSIYDKYDYFDYAATTPPYDPALLDGFFAAYQGNLSQTYNTDNRENVKKINNAIINYFAGFSDFPNFPSFDCNYLKNLRDLGKTENNESEFTKKYNLIWTSGASEANNTVLKSFSLTGGKIIIGNTEHHTSLACLEDPVNFPGFSGFSGFSEFSSFSGSSKIDSSSGFSDIDRVKTKNTKNYTLYDFRFLDGLYQAITPDTKLISIMHVNNETGYIYQISKICEIVNQYRKNNNTSYPYIHSDMSQSFGKMELPFCGTYSTCPEKSNKINNINKLDIITASSHKFYGPLGAGFIICNKDIQLIPMIYGTQQNGMRGGTVNYPAIVATYTSLQLTVSDQENQIKKARKYNDEIAIELMKNFKTINIFDTKVFDPKNFEYLQTTSYDSNLSVSPISPIIGFYPGGSPYILSFSVIVPKGTFSNIVFKDKMLEQKIIIGTGSACSAGSSTVLTNLGLPDEANQGFIRISFGRLTTDKAVRKLKTVLIRELKKWFSM